VACGTAGEAFGGERTGSPHPPSTTAGIRAVQAVGRDLERRVLGCGSAGSARRWSPPDALEDHPDLHLPAFQVPQPQQRLILQTTAPGWTTTERLDLLRMLGTLSG